MKSQPYIDACIKAGERTRSIVYLLVFAFAINAAYCSTSEHGWATSEVNLLRLRKLILQKQLLVMNQNANPKDQTVDKQKLKDLEDRISDFPDWKRLTKLANEENKRLGTDIPGQIKNIDEELSARNREDIQKRSVALPFVNISIHPNDLGAFGGFIVFCLGTLLLLSTNRQYENLRLTFSVAAKSDELLEAYDLVSMGQVLSTPNPRTVTIGSQAVAIRNVWSYLYALLPVIAQALIVYYDANTAKLGLELNQERAIDVLVAESVFLFLIACTTILNLLVVSKAGNLWSSIHYKIEVDEALKLYEKQGLGGLSCFPENVRLGVLLHKIKDVQEMQLSD